MKIPRDCDGPELASALRRLDNELVRQTGSDMQLTTSRGGEHHITIPNHRPLKVGLLSALLKDVAAHHHLSVEQLIRELKL